jgi:hypothetical protein
VLNTPLTHCFQLPNIPSASPLIVGKTAKRQNKRAAAATAGGRSSAGTSSFLKPTAKARSHQA